MPYEAETRIDLAQKLYTESVREREERERHISTVTLGLSAIDIEEGLRKDSETELRVRKPESCHEYHLHY